jgi:DNA-binding response OmpR family regulator
VSEPLSIVVADDDPDVLRLVARRLARRGYVVHTAANGRSALEEVRRTFPDAVVLDGAMPGMSGGEACAALKADAGTARIPVVMLSAQAAEADIVAGLDAGADEYLTKPFAIDELDETLRHLVALARTGDQDPAGGRYR